MDSGGCRKDLYDNLLTHLGQFAHASRAICSRILGNFLTHPSTPHQLLSAAVNGGDPRFRRVQEGPVRQSAHASRAICSRISGNLLTHLGQFAYASRAICFRISGNLLTHPSTPHQLRSAAVNGRNCGFRRVQEGPVRQFAHASRAICSRISGNLLTHPSTPHQLRSAAFNGGDRRFRGVQIRPEPNTLNPDP